MIVIIVLSVVVLGIIIFAIKQKHSLPHLTEQTKDRNLSANISELEPRHDRSNQATVPKPSTVEVQESLTPKPTEKLDVKYLIENAIKYRHTYPKNIESIRLLREASKDINVSKLIITELVKCLQSGPTKGESAEQARKRSCAACLLGDVGDASSIDVLIEHLSDVSPQEKEWAEALGGYMGGDIDIGEGEAVGSGLEDLKMEAIL